MAYVITEPCKGVKDASCVEVCPVDCIHSDDDQEIFFIDPNECIDCGACESVCPVSAIYYQDDVPSEWQQYIALNERYFAAKLGGSVPHPPSSGGYRCQ